VEPIGSALIDLAEAAYNLERDAVGAYQLGLSKGRVSTLMSSAMRKLGVQTRAQLIKKLRDFRTITDA